MKYFRQNDTLAVIEPNATLCRVYDAKTMQLARQFNIKVKLTRDSTLCALLHTVPPSLPPAKFSLDFLSPYATCFVHCICLIGFASQECATGQGIMLRNLYAVSVLEMRVLVSTPYGVNIFVLQPCLLWDGVRGICCA